MVGAGAASSSASSSSASRLRIHDVDPVVSEPLVRDWTLRNVCVTFYNWRGTLHRAEFISRERVDAVIHSFSEYTFKYDRLAYVRAEAPEDAPALDRCERRALGLAFTVTSNNLYHQFFHAVPAFETLLSKVEPGAIFVPIVSSKAAAWLPPALNTSHAWEFSMRAFSSAPPSQLFDDLLRLLRAPCTCFDRVEGATGGVSLYYPKARCRILAFCRRAVAVARATPPIAPPLPMEVRQRAGGSRGGGMARLLYVRRASKKRVLANDPEVSAALCGGGAHWHAECLALEKYSLTQQMRTIAASNVMVGVHGQAMVWMPFMLTEQERVAVVEVLLPRVPGTKSVSSPRMYAHFADAMQIHHTAVYGTLLPECRASKKDVLGCNVTVGVAPLLAGVHQAIAHVTQ